MKMKMKRGRVPPEPATRSPHQNGNSTCLLPARAWASRASWPLSGAPPNLRHDRASEVLQLGDLPRVPETMKYRASYIILVLFALIASSGFAQRSCVFLPESENTWGEYDRPEAKLHPVRILSVPKSQSIPSAAPDFPNINVSLYLLRDQDEPTIAINPIDPNNMILGANDYRSYSSLLHHESFDGGLTWNSDEFASTWIFAATPTDPAIAFNASGNAFYSYGRIAASGKPLPQNDIVCAHSSNGGKAWSLPVRVIFDSTNIDAATTFADKYFIAADKLSSSPFRDRVYISWIEYTPLHQGKVRLSSSSDTGVTWTQPIDLTGLGNYQSPIPAVGIGGVVYVVYTDIDTTKHEILFAVSSDGSKTFSPGKKISNYKDLGPLLPLKDPSAHPTIKGGLRVNSFPSIAVDHSTTHNGRIYVTWAAMGNDLRHHIFLSISDDGGNNWSISKAVENDPSPLKTDKFFPWIAVDDVNGDVGIACYDSRSDPENILTDLYMLLSNDGGQSFIPERISGVSSDVKVSSSGFGPEYFFGDYIGLAGHNKIWHPAWTDSRVGYDQDVYTSIVRPYSPSAPRNFAATEDSSSHFPDLSWEHSSVTTFGAQLGEYVFRLKRLDGGLQIDLPKITRSFIDSSALKNTNYTYSLQVVTTDGDTSASVSTKFSPRANKEPMPPVITSAKAEFSGMTVNFTIPDKNVGATTIQHLNMIHFLVNGIVTESVAISDAERGAQRNKFFQFFTDGYYNIQLAASTKQENGDTTLSVLTSPKWLYAGVPPTSYYEDFSVTKNIFSIFPWDVTTAAGKLPSEFINDSLPDVPYQKDIDSWFLLPPVTIGSETHTLEFSHIALVAPGDSAIIEISTNDGVGYLPIRNYDRTSHPADWGNSLADSKPASEAIALKELSGQDVIVRFRLRTHSSGGDGWFLDSIRFTQLLSTPLANLSKSFRAELAANPIRIGSEGKIKLFSDKPTHLTVNFYSLLGKKLSTPINNKPVFAGDYEFEFSPDKEGCYFYEIISLTSGSVERRYGKFVVVP